MPDIKIKLGAGEYNLRPTFGAMREIEAKTDSGCNTLLNLLAKSEMHASEMAIIVYFGLEAAGEKATDLEAVGNRIFEQGPGSEAIRDAIAAYLIELLWAPDTAKKKAVGVWWKANAAIISGTFFEPLISSAGDLANSGKPRRKNSGRSSKPSAKKPLQ